MTPFMDRDKVTKPSSQCSFIGYVLLPLFEALGQLFPDLEVCSSSTKWFLNCRSPNDFFFCKQEMIVHPVRYALDYYRKLNEAVKDEQRQQRKSVVTLEPSNSSTLISPNSPGCGSHGCSSITTLLEAKMMQQVNLHLLRHDLYLFIGFLLNICYLVEIGRCVDTFGRRRSKSRRFNRRGRRGDQN